MLLLLFIAGAFVFISSVSAVTKASDSWRLGGVDEETSDKNLVNECYGVSVTTKS